MTVTAGALRTARPGDPFHLGATPVAGGTNFAVASGTATAMVLCLFDGAGLETRVELKDYDAGVWYGFVPGVGAGQAYGFRAMGPYDPWSGQRCNPEKLLLDPYARATTGSVRFGPEVLGYQPGSPDSRSSLDSAGHVPLSLVVDPTFEWRNPRPPWRWYASTVIYEVHVKGFTMSHPDVPPAIRGTYAGMAHDAAIAHLTDLGITTVELLPIHQNVPEAFLLDRGLTNYWGYNTIGYFAPHDGYSAEVRAGHPGGQVGEFKAMVDALHGAGLELIIDVVFNHTAEGNQLGPTLCFRGLDNPAYYRLAGDPRYYVDTTGCGNTFNAADPMALKLVMDSLRYWLTDMGVDGFRFDLAPTLGRQEGGFDRVSAFFDLVLQDPVVSQAKLFAEPWDVGRTDSYELGRFPPMWREWNGQYRDTVRDFWRSHEGLLGKFASRFAGSSDIFASRGRRPTSSVNLITVHDGFTLEDLVSYNDKHNESNGEDNRDGSNDNRSWNCGTEGPATDADVVALRNRQKRAMLATLLLSFGIPLLLGGDEMGRTQRGNNNAYCQDNDITWFDWSSVDREILEFTRKLIGFRLRHPVFRRRRFLAGAETAELQWFTPAGTAMTEANWDDPNARSLTLHLDGSHDPDRGPDGDLLVDDDFLVMFNAWWEPLGFTIPATRPAQRWWPEIDTHDPETIRLTEPSAAGDRVVVGPRSLTVLGSPRIGSPRIGEERGPD